MGMVYAEITLKNAGDAIRVQEGLITEQEVRAVTVQALVDTGAGTLVITGEVMQRLGLAVRGLRRASLANNAKGKCITKYGGSYFVIHLKKTVRQVPAGCLFGLS